MLALNNGIITAADRTPLILTEKIDPGFYSVNFNEKDNYFYAYGINPYTLPEKIYGEDFNNNERILDTAKLRFDEGKATTVLLRGVKGSGKTLTLKQLALDHVAKGGIVLQISQPFFGEGLIAFLTAFRNNHTMVVIDEFEKVYNEKEEMQGLLSLLDGTGTLPLFTLLTCNKVSSDMEYFINRPGRVYFKIDFSGLSLSVIEDYCKQELEIQELYSQIKDYSVQFKHFTLDMLSVLVTELNNSVTLNKYRGKTLNVIFNDVVDILNIKPDRSPIIKVSSIKYRGIDVFKYFTVNNLGYLKNHGYFNLTFKNKDNNKEDFETLIKDVEFLSVAQRSHVQISVAESTLEVTNDKIQIKTLEGMEIEIIKVPFEGATSELNLFFNKQIDYVSYEED